jgi:tetratricopeptide (TPR) repeat protein
MTFGRFSLALFLLVLLSPHATPAQAQPTPVPGAARPSDLFLVLPFEPTRRDPRYAWLGEGLGVLFAERLAADDRLVFPREEWLAALEKLGLPPSARFTRATMLKVAEQMDADFIIFGRYATDGKQLSVTGYVLQVAPPALSPAFTETGALDEVMEVQARAAWQAMRFTDALYPLSQAAYVQKFPRHRLDAFEQYIRGLLASEDGRLRHFREAARLDPEWVEPAYALGEAYYAARHCEPALSWLSRVPPGHARGVEAAFRTGVCHLLRNDAVRAESALRGAMSALARRNPRAVLPGEVHNNLAIALSRQGKHAEAAAQWQRAQQADPEQPDYWFNAALGALRTAEFSQAVRSLRELLKRNAEDGDARALLVATLERAGRSTEAAVERERCAADTCGASAVMQATLRAAQDVARGGAADPFLKLERLSREWDAGALLFAGRAIAENGAGSARVREHLEIHLARGRRALAEGRAEEAVSDFSEAVLLAPEAGEARMALAETYQRLGRIEEAIRELRAVLWSGENPEARVRLARMYISLGQASEARAELRAALRADPAHGEARRMLEALEAAGGRR